MYAKGDGVTFGGSLFIAQTDAPAGKPEETPDWRLAVKRGREGKPGPKGIDGKDGKPENEGRDVVALVSFEIAKRHLRVSHIQDDDDILFKLEIASEEIRDYLRGNTSIDAAVLDAWDETSDVPAPVLNATLLRLTYLYEHRGDDPEGDDECWNSIEMVLTAVKNSGGGGWRYYVNREARCAIWSSSRIRVTG